MLFDGLTALLATSTDFQALVGTPAERQTSSNGADATNGIFPAVAPEAAIYPYVVMTQISGEGYPTMDGSEALHSARIQFTSYSDDYGVAKRLQRVLRQLLESFHATLAEGTRVDNAILVLEMDGWEEAPQVFAAPADYEFIYADIGS